MVGFGFGTPRVVWGPLHKDVKRRLEGFVVVRNASDLVTHLPPILLGFRHVGYVCRIQKKGEQFHPVRDHYPDCYESVLAMIGNSDKTDK